MKIEEVLKIPDRSVWIDYEGVITAITRTDYFNECEYRFYRFVLFIEDNIGRPKSVWVV